MNQKAHITGGIILAGAAMIAGNHPFLASLAVFGCMFNDMDYAEIPWISKRYHRKLFHNIFIIGLFAALSIKFLPSGLWALGMLLHNVMDMFSSSPVYVVWPVSREGEHWGVGGWGVPNKTMLSYPVGIGVAAVFSVGYLTATGHLPHLIALLENLCDLLF